MLTIIGRVAPENSALRRIEYVRCLLQIARFTIFSMEAPIDEERLHQLWEALACFASENTYLVTVNVLRDSMPLVPTMNLRKALAANVFLGTEKMGPWYADRFANKIVKYQAYQTRFIVMGIIVFLYLLSLLLQEPLMI